MGETLDELGRRDGVGDGVRRDVPHGRGELRGQRRLDVPVAAHVERPQRQQGVGVRAGPQRQAGQDVPGLPGVDGDEHGGAVAKFARPLPRHGRALDRGQPQRDHGPVLGRVRELLGGGETGPGAAAGVVGMPVGLPLLPLPRVDGRRRSPRGRAGEGHRRDAVVELGGQPRTLRNGQGDHQFSRMVVSDPVQVEPGHRRLRRPRIRVRAAQAPAVLQAQGDAVVVGRPPGDPGKRLMDEPAPQPGQHGGPGARKLRGVRVREPRSYDVQLGGECPLRDGSAHTVVLSRSNAIHTY